MLNRCDVLRWFLRCVGSPGFASLVSALCSVLVLCFGGFRVVGSLCYASVVAVGVAVVAAGVVVATGVIVVAGSVLVVVVAGVVGAAAGVCDVVTAGVVVVAASVVVAAGVVAVVAVVAVVVIVAAGVVVAAAGVAVVSVVVVVVKSRILIDFGTQNAPKLVQNSTKIGPKIDLDSISGATTPPRSNFDRF